MFGFPVQEGFNLQTSAGVFNPLALKGLDIAVAEAGRNNLRLVVALMNNWNYNPLQTDWKCAPPDALTPSQSYTIATSVVTRGWPLRGLKKSHQED